MIRFFVLFLLFYTKLTAQPKTPEDFGLKVIETSFKNDKVSYLVLSKKGEESMKKPLFFFCQGSGPQPLIKYDGDGMYGILPFNTDSLTNHFHIVIVSKPSTPIIENVSNLKNNFQVLDSTGTPLKAYSDRSYLEYYVSRNIRILKSLRKEKWVDSKTLVVAGHSEGSTIAANMSFSFKKITHLIYSGGNPAGRILSIIQEENQKDSDTLSLVKNEMEYWKMVCGDSHNLDNTFGDSNKTTYSFSKNIITNLLNLKIPVLVTFGSLDWSAPFINLLEIESIRAKKNNFTFNGYINTEHNFFPVDKLRNINYSIYNWDKVGLFWLQWIKKSSHK
ncbi:MAG TPA: hypothetical protein VK175_20420 [Leadbetterella sp.]|nr:hypothetical protein [Leadbetterella sp.]